MISLLIIIGILIVFVCTISMCKIAKKTMPAVVYDTWQKRATKVSSKPFLKKSPEHVSEPNTTVSIPEQWNKPLVAL